MDPDPVTPPTRDSLVKDSAAELPDWEALYDTLGERVFRFVYRMTRNVELGEDLTHDTFVRAHQRRRQYSGRGSVKSWVFQIAANVVRDHMRRRKLRLIHSVGGQAHDRRPHEGADHADRLTLQRALDELSEPQRLVVFLHDIDGFNHREIALLLEIAEGTSKARLSRARALLRHALTEQTNEAER